MHYIGVICWYMYYFIQEWLSHNEATQEWEIGASYTQDVLAIYKAIYKDKQSRILVT